MLYEFNRGSTAAAATGNICAAYGDGAVDNSTCYRWFAKFHSEDTTLTDKSRPGRPVELDDKALNTLLQVNPRQTTRELATQFHCSHMTVNHHFHAIDKVNKYGDSDPRQLSTNPWSSVVSVKGDPNAFLFTLTNPHHIPPTKYPIDPDRENDAVYHFESSEPCFDKSGARCDIDVSNFPKETNYTNTI